MKDQWRKQEEQAKAAEHEVQLKKKLLRQEYEEFSRCLYTLPCEPS